MIVGSGSTRPLFAAFAVVACLAPSCRSTTADPAAARARIATLVPDGAPSTQQLPFDERLLQRRVRTGDRVDLSIVRKSEDHSEERSWSMSIVAPDEPFEAYSFWFHGTFDVADQTFEQHLRSSRHTGTVIAVEAGEDGERANAGLALGLFERGIIEGLGRGLVIKASFDDENGATTDYATTLRPLVFAVAQFIAISRVATTHPLPRKIILANIDKPPLLSVLFRLDVNVLPHVFEAVEIETEFGPGFRIPFDVMVNDSLAFVGAVTAVEPRGVLALTAGVVAIEGVAPSRPNRILELRLVGASEADRGTTITTEFEDLGSAESP